MECSLAKCTNPECKEAPYDSLNAIMNKLTIVVRNHIKKYYQVRKLSISSPLQIFQ